MAARVLLVEDEPAIRDGIATCLRLRGFEVVTADTLSAARDRLAAQCFDAAITDWQLPDGQVEALRDELRSLRWIVVSGQSASLRERLPEAEVFTKPAGISELIDALSSVREDVEPEVDAIIHNRLSDASRRFCSLCDSGFERRIESGELILSGSSARQAEIEDLVREIGGDLRRHGDRVEWVLHVDGRPDDTVRVIPGTRFSVAEGAALWIDFGTERPSDEALAGFLRDLESAQRRGCRLVRTDEVPPWFESPADLERPSELDGRGRAPRPELAPIGPILGAELGLLWNS